MVKWEKSGRPAGNEVLVGDGFYVSFVTGAATAAWAGGIFASDRGEDETALCIDGDFFILNGDFRKEYEELAPRGKDACLAFYRSQNDRSSWSDD